MAICKDCIHYKVCCQKSLHVVTGMDFVYRYKYNHIERECKDFKDRSRFVELPCKVGDTVYFIKKGKIIKDSVRDINYFSSWKGFEFNTLVDKWYEEDIGHKIYFTLEEAEQALK